MSILATLAATAAAANASPAEPDLSWLAGYWISCAGGREVTETWSDPRAGAMFGYSVTLKDERLFYEYARIARSSAGQTLSFYAMPNGAPPTEFAAKEVSGKRVVFENPAHDFPQRVIYERKGKTLIGRIEGATEGAESALEWRYTLAKQNARCR